LEQVTQILLDQPFPRLTPPQHDVLLDAPGDDEGRRRFSRQRLLSGVDPARLDLARFGSLDSRPFREFCGSHHFLQNIKTTSVR
jgi:hypothetical protein